SCPESLPSSSASAGVATRIVVIVMSRAAAQQVIPCFSGQSLSTRLCVRRDHACHNLGNLLAGRNVQELVRAMRVGMRTQYAGDEELRLREFFAQHAHER